MCCYSLKTTKCHMAEWYEPHGLNTALTFEFIFRVLFANSYKFKINKDVINTNRYGCKNYNIKKL